MIKETLEKIIAGEMSLEEQKAFLVELNEKGYGPDEMKEFIDMLLLQMPIKLNMQGAIDICGTGGSGLPRINTSTISAIVLAACGVNIAKHGNKAASGRFGSFDLLEALGFNISPDPKQLERIYEQSHLAFIFARQFHPVMKYFGPVRSELGIKTIFNLLGPMLNPAGASRQVIGSSNMDDARKLIETAKLMGKKHVLVVHGSDKLDEVTLTGSTHVFELKDGEVTEYELSPADFGFEVVSFDEIAGGDKEANVRISREILNGNCKSAHLNLVLANCALILKFDGKVDELKEGVRMAKEAIESGAAAKVFELYNKASHKPVILSEIENYKKSLIFEEIQDDLQKSERDFKAALSGKDNLSFICEIKRASPSDSEIDKVGLSVSEITRQYESGGASALSVLTDEKYFKGSFDALAEAREACDLPILCKDFVIDERQIYMARKYGADAILLIVALLDADTIERFLGIARSLGMDAIVEVHTKDELDVVLQTSAEIIGINNRDLHTFEIKMSTVFDLARYVPTDKIVVAESGYDDKSVRLIRGSFDAVLVGSSLMKSGNISNAMEIMTEERKVFKVCGVRTREIASYCDNGDATLIGLNFVPTSKRNVSISLAKELCESVEQTVLVGVFQNQPVEEVNDIADELDLDFVQLSGDEDVNYMKQIERPIIKTIRINAVPENLGEFDKYVSIYIVDGKDPGSGEGYDYKRINELELGRPFLVAGGISDENACDVVSIHVPKCLGIDIASGIETNGEIDTMKIMIIEPCL